MIWGDICNNGRTDLYVINKEALMGLRYRIEFLKPTDVLYAAAVGDKFILIDDNAGSHRAHLVYNFTFDEGIIRIELPACFPDRTCP